MAPSAACTTLKPLCAVLQQLDVTLDHVVSFTEPSPNISVPTPLDSTTTNTLGKRLQLPLQSSLHLALQLPLLLLQLPLQLLLRYTFRLVSGGHSGTICPSCRLQLGYQQTHGEQSLEVHFLLPPAS